VINVNPFLRQSDIIDTELLNNLSMSIIGCRSIGSFSALTLTKLGVGTLVLYDMDKVEPHNVSNQFFVLDDLDTYKAEATLNHCQHYKANTEQQIISVNDKFTNQQIKTELVLASVDNIEGRHNIFNMANQSPECKLYLDARMLADNLKIFTVDLTNDNDVLSFYKEFIEDVENQIAPCTRRTIIYNVLMCASLIGSIVKKYVEREPLPLHVAYCFSNNYQIVDKGEKTN